MKKVIINADDFGLSSSINEGIIRGYREGVITSASFIVNMPGFEDALRLIRKNPELSVGIHINIIRGLPILSADNLKSFTKRGYFLGNIFKLLGAIYSKRLNLKELEMECRAQIEMLLKHRINITHLDSEKHIHMIKPIFEIISRTAKDYGITKIRFINKIPLLYQNISSFSLFFKKQFYRNLLLKITSACNRPIITRYNIKTTDYFYDISQAGNITSYMLKRILCSLKKGTTEIMCHPGYIGEEWRQHPLCKEKYYLNLNRELELKALLDFRLIELIRKLNIKLISFKEL